MAPLESIRSPVVEEPARILVTGGAGFIGSHTVELLLSMGYRVRVLDDFSSGRGDNLPNSPRLQIMVGDVRDPGTVTKAMLGVQRCLHLAAQVSVTRSLSEPAESATHNIIGLVNVLEAATLQKVQRVVYASSAAVYGHPQRLPVSEDLAVQPISPYGLEKLVDEHYAQLYTRLYGLSTMGLRYFNVFGTRQDPDSPYSGVISRFNDALRRGKPVTIYGDGQQTRDFIYVKDVAAANVAALQSAAQGTVNVATGERTSLLGLLQEMGQALRVQPQAQHQAARRGDIVHSCGSARLARELLDFEARWSLSQGLREMIPARTAVAA